MAKELKRLNEIEVEIARLENSLINMNLSYKSVFNGDTYKLMDINKNINKLNKEKKRILKELDRSK